VVKKAGISREHIGATLRELRQQRTWTQGELASKLGVSQNWISVIENGDGSLTAEQFLRVLELFNVPASRFAATLRVEDDLQQALARLGATHLYVAGEGVPSEQLQEANRLVVEALVDGTSRIVTALAPVLLQQAEAINLWAVSARLEHLGLANRLPWLVENTLVAGRETLTRVPDTTLGRAFRRNAFGLEIFLDMAQKLAEGFRAGANEAARKFGIEIAPVPEQVDVLDKGVRSRRTLETLAETRSEISKRWHIISALTPKDFQEALEDANAADR
jgi:transcriptional regulator with XRE-family HTH domain